MDKTPISLLQEICAHNGLTADYQLMSVEGVVHAPTFVFRVQVGEYATQATGTSKKKAKHAVAKAIIEILIKDSELQIENTDDITQMLAIEADVSKEESVVEEKVDDEDDENARNPVGKLQEICMKKRWCPPSYKTISEEGLPHERLFKMKCILENMEFEEIGEGKSKRLAKRKAADRMIRRLKCENLTEADEVTEKLLDKKKNSNPSFISDWIEKKSSGNIIPAQEKIDNFFLQFDDKSSEDIDNLVNSSLKTDSETSFDFVNADEDYMTNLAELAKTSGCVVKYLTVPEISLTGLYQCLVHVIPDEPIYADLPVLTAWGSADQLETAKQFAAGNAIKLFSVLKSANKDIISLVELVKQYHLDEYDVALTAKC